MLGLAVIEILKDPGSGQSAVIKIFLNQFVIIIGVDMSQITNMVRNIVWRGRFLGRGMIRIVRMLGELIFVRGEFNS